MNTTESNNLLEVWDKLCEIIDNKGSVVQFDSQAKQSEQVRFNQIKLNRESTLWKSIMAVLEPLSEEEIAVLVDLSKPNDTHAVYQSKVSIAFLVSIPLGILYAINLILPSFSVGESGLTPFSGGLIGGLVALFVVGSYMLYKQLAFRWLSMELNTCLETALVLKKAESIKFKKYELPKIEGKKTKIDKKAKIVLEKTPIELPTKKS